MLNLPTLFITFAKLTFRKLFYFNGQYIMKNKFGFIINVTILTFLSVGFLRGQERNPIFEQKQTEFKVLQEKIRQAASVSESAQELRNKLEDGDDKGVVDASNTGDVSLIPLLELYVGKSRSFADVALIKLGKTEYLSHIIDQTRKEETLATRYYAIRKLVLIKKKEAYKRLYELLDETEIPNCELDDESYAPISTVVMGELSKVADNPPTKKGLFPDEKSIFLWKKWFTDHKKLIE